MAVSPERTIQGSCTAAGVICVDNPNSSLQTTLQSTVVLQHFHPQLTSVLRKTDVSDVAHTDGLTASPGLAENPATYLIFSHFDVCGVLFVCFKGRIFRHSMIWLKSSNLSPRLSPTALCYGSLYI